MFRRVVGVDAGYANFAVCGIRSDQVLRPYYWQNKALFTGAFSEEKLCQKIFEWIKSPEVKQLLDEADLIVLERQMTMKFQAINHCIRFLYFDKTKEFHPATVGAFFKLPKTRKDKKKAAVELVGANLPFPVKKGKKDDYADAFLLASYGHFLTNPQLREGWRQHEFHGSAEGSGKKRKVRRDSSAGTSGGRPSRGGSEIIDAEPFSFAGAGFLTASYESAGKRSRE